MEAQNKNRIAIKFAVSLFLLYLIFSQANIFMNSVLSPGGKFFNTFFYENINYIQWLRTALIKPAVGLFRLFGLQAISNNTEVLVINGPKLNVNYSCLGLGIMSFITAFIISFPIKKANKIKNLLICFLIVYVLNIVRIAGLGVFLTLFHSQKKYANYHHEIFNLVMYIIIIFILYKWIKKHEIINESKN